MAITREMLFPLAFYKKTKFNGSKGKICYRIEKISEEDGDKLIASFKKISSKKASEDESDDNDQRKKKYRQQHKESAAKTQVKTEKVKQDKEKDDDEIER